MDTLARTRFGIREMAAGDPLMKHALFILSEASIRQGSFELRLEIAWPCKPFREDPIAKMLQAARLRLLRANTI